MYKIIWLYLSAFGIMFAILSWGQEANILPTLAELDFPSTKGFMALISGILLYKYVAKRMD